MKDLITVGGYGQLRVKDLITVGGYGQLRVLDAVTNHQQPVILLNVLIRHTDRRFSFSFVF